MVYATCSEINDKSNVLIKGSNRSMLRLDRILNFLYEFNIRLIIIRILNSYFSISGIQPSKYFLVTKGTFVTDFE
jgi:hypothetical protein